jgi:hypothetical protein
MRSEHLENDEALQSFLRGFEDGALPKAEWTHGAHVAAAAYYLHGESCVQGAARDGAYDTAYDSVLPVMRQRIQSFNLAVGGANTATSGYHETLTRFWLRVVTGYLRERRPESGLEAARLAVGEFGEQRALHTVYYSGDVVKDSTARLGWREPDLLPLP